MVEHQYNVCMLERCTHANRHRIIMNFAVLGDCRCAGYDIFASEAVQINGFGRKRVPTGIEISLPKGILKIQPSVILKTMCFHITGIIMIS